MIDENKVLKIEKVIYLGEYKLELFFDDGAKKLVDFGPFLLGSLNPLINKYLDLGEFKKYELDDGDLEWNDYDLCFPIADLYENRIKP